jgi:hypothetical protein
VKPAAVSHPVFQPPSTGLASDAACLREAQAALIQGDARAALDAAGRVRPTGPLAEEREGILILARCALNDPAGQEQARVFIQKRPEAPLSLRIRAACLEKTAP